MESSKAQGLVMKTIKLYGHLGKQFGKIHRYAIDTPSEAVRLLCANYKGFEQALINFTGAGYKVFVGKENIGLEDLHTNTGQDVIKIVPIIQGAGDSTLNMVLIGAAFMVVAPWAIGLAAQGLTAGMSLAAATTTITAATYISGAAASFGMALILGGVASMLYSPPDKPNEAKKSTDGYFDGAVNTTRQGVPVPLGYGELIVGSAVISAGLYIESVAV